MQALCRYADGTNSVTGVDTRKSLGENHILHLSYEPAFASSCLPALEPTPSQLAMKQRITGAPTEHD